MVETKTAILLAVPFCIKGSLENLIMPSPGSLFYIVPPPSMRSCEPVMRRLSSHARNTTPSAISFDVPIRPKG